MVGVKNKKCNLGPSALFMALISTFQHDYHNNQLAVWWPSLLRLATQRPTAIFDSVASTRIFQAKVVCLTLGSS